MGNFPALSSLSSLGYYKRIASSRIRKEMYHMEYAFRTTPIRVEICHLPRRALPYFQTDSSLPLPLHPTSLYFTLPFSSSFLSSLCLLTFPRCCFIGFPLLPSSTMRWGVGVFCLLGLSLIREAVGNGVFHTIRNCQECVSI